ncbi:cysteine desulfurase [Actinotalea fermentans]|uniref:cysteine desulfurase n=2 Tax=Actinotalea fermentans TaxID=43671 RepID=A0A511YT81_9CELL|nr:cysteine desulfurase [Actinotalea fermentans]
MRPEAVAALAEEAARVGNPSSVHQAGRAARKVVEEAREVVADRLGAHPTEVVFTSGGTEADNLAVRGLGRPADGAVTPRRVVVSAVEHHAVLDPAAWLAAHEGAELVLLPVDDAGTVPLSALEEALDGARGPGAVVSVMWANNEVGTVQPVAGLAAVARERGAFVHADAVQAVGRLPVDFAAAGLDAMTVSAHKLGGPVGVGALVVRRGVPVEPLTHGGGQERGLRSGTVPAALIRSFAVALDLATAERQAEAARVAGLRDALVAGVLREVPDAVVRGPWPGTAAGALARLPGNAHLTFPGCDSEVLLFGLDQAGVAASAGSACQAGVQQASHVLAAMGVPAADARGAVRFSLGWTSTAADVAAVTDVIGEVVARARAAAHLG